MVKRFLMIGIIVLLSVGVQAQKVMKNTSILNYQRSDVNRVHFGFMLGINYMDYKVLLSGINPYRAESGKLDIGFSVGMISELRITPDLALRLLPGLEFASRSLVYTDPIGETTYAYTESIYAAVPLMLKYKARRINNFRPYVTAGGSMKYDFQRHDNLDPEKSVLVRTKPVEAFLETGIGCDFYLPYFKFGLELRFSLGMTDVLVHEFDPEFPGYEGYTAAVKKLNSRMFSVCFNFE